jgi:hypothetical protein
VKLKVNQFLLFIMAAALLLAGRPVLAQVDEEVSPEGEEEVTEETPEEGAEETPDEGTAPEEGAPEAGEETEAAVEETEEAVEEVEPPPPEEEPAMEAEVSAGAALETEAAAPGGAAAEVDLKAEAKPSKPSPFRNSYIVYENTFSAYTLNKDAQLTYNPYYAMSYSFRPRYYIYKGLWVGLRWDLEQELTNADDTTKKRQVIWSDVLLDLAWTAVYTIPAVDILITPKIRIELPASLASQAKTLYLALGPGFDLTKIFDVWGGITLQYSFRYTKYFNQYTSTLSEEPLLECPEKGPCQYDVIGPQNPSHRFLNDFILEVRPIPKFYIAATVEVRNYLTYKVPEAEVDTLTGSVTLPSSGKRHQGLMWYVFDIGYDILPYLTVSVGTSTYNPMLNPESEYYPPFFNRYTNLYLDIALDMDGMINAIVKGGSKQKTAKDRI